MRGAKPQITARILEGLDEFLKSYPGTNVTLARLLEEAGQPLVEGRLPAGQIPIDTVATVLELAARRTRAPCFGLHFARAYPVGATGVLGFMLVNAPDVRAMMACLERFTRLQTDAIDFSVAEAGSMIRVTWGFSPEMTAPSQQLIAFVLALLIFRVQHIINADWMPDKVEFTFAEPNMAGEYETVFGRNLFFGAPHNRLTAKSSILRRSSPAANPLLFETLKEIAEKDLAAYVPATDLAGRLNKYISENVGLGGVDLEGAARAVDLAPRQLQTELQHLDTTFEAEVSLIRQRRATRYLRDTELSMTEIALLLGYSELSAFTRAAKSWFQKPPTEMRAELRASAPD